MTIDIWTSSSIQDLSDGDITSFQEIVLRDVKNKFLNSEERTILINNLDLWLFCLRILRKGIELQLTQSKINVREEVRRMRIESFSSDEIESYVISENKWRSNAIKFLTAIERKNLYVKLLLDEQDLD
jgi:hypothetical protein